MSGRDDARVALVTGGSRGIGAAVVRLLARRGIRTAFTYRDSAAEAAELATEFPDLLHPVGFALGDAASAEAAVSSTVQRFGHLDTLISNAGIWKGGLLTRIDMADWGEVVSTNVEGTARLCRAALPALRSAPGDRSITLMASVIAFEGGAGDTAYTAAKAAIVGFGRALAREVTRDRIRVNTLAPGFVDTDMTRALPDAAADRIAADIALGRPGTAEEVAAAATYLGVDATYCTGSVLVVDGGWSL